MRMRHQLLAALLAAAAAMVVACGDAETTVSSGFVSYEVKRGHFEHSVTARGSLQPKQELNCIAKRSGYITSIEPDASLVKKGQVIVTLDASGIETEILEDTGDLRVMEAELASLVADLVNRKNEARAQITDVEREYQLAETRYRNLKGGAYIDPSTRIAARENAASAKVSAAARAAELEVLSKLRGSGAVTEEEFATLAGQAAVSSAGAREAAAGYDRVLEGAEPQEVAAASVDVKLKQYRLQVVKRWLLDLEKQEEEIKRRQHNRIEREKRGIDRLKTALTEAVIHAPATGVILHKEFWGRKIGVGRRIWRGVTLCSVADTSSMRVSIKVDGRTRALLQPGLRAEVHLPAISGRVFAARVTDVGKFGRDAFEHLDARTKNIVGEADRRVFDIMLVLEDTAPLLMPGLMARVKIVIAEVDDVLLVPREAVRVLADGSGTVEVLKGSVRTQRAVELGARSRQMVVIKRGLEAGERVVIGG